jgi:hypothetical protein
MELPAGPAILQSWLSNDDGVVRGAYFVEVEKSSTMLGLVRWTKLQ